MNTGKVILGVLAGAVSGAVLGILFAPAKGSETRKKISKISGEYKDATKKKIDNIVVDVTDRYEHVKGGIADLIDSNHSKEVVSKK